MEKVVYDGNDDRSYSRLEKLYDTRPPMDENSLPENLNVSQFFTPEKKETPMKRQPEKPKTPAQKMKELLENPEDNDDADNSLDFFNQFFDPNNPPSANGQLQKASDAPNTSQQAPNTSTQISQPVFQNQSQNHNHYEQNQNRYSHSSQPSANQDFNNQYQQANGNLMTCQQAPRSSAQQPSQDHQMSLHIPVLNTGEYQKGHDNARILSQMLCHQKPAFSAEQARQAFVKIVRNPQQNNEEQQACSSSSLPQFTHQEYIGSQISATEKARMKFAQAIQNPRQNAGQMSRKRDIAGPLLSQNRQIVNQQLIQQNQVFNQNSCQPKKKRLTLCQRAQMLIQSAQGNGEQNGPCSSGQPPAKQVRCNVVQDPQMMDPPGHKQVRCTAIEDPRMIVLNPVEPGSSSQVSARVVHLDYHGSRAINDQFETAQQNRGHVYQVVAQQQNYPEGHLSMLAEQKREADILRYRQNMREKANARRRANNKNRRNIEDAKPRVVEEYSLTYLVLSILAALNTENHAITSEEVTRFVLHNFPTYRHRRNDSWRSSVRHALSNSPMFMRSNDEHHKNCVYKIAEEVNVHKILTPKDRKYIDQFIGEERFQRMIRGEIGLPRRLFYNVVKNPQLAGPENSALFYHCLSVGIELNDNSPLFQVYTEYNNNLQEPFFEEEGVRHMSILNMKSDYLNVNPDSTNLNLEAFNVEMANVFHQNIGKYFFLLKWYKDRQDPLWRITPHNVMLQVVIYEHYTVDEIMGMM